MNALMAMLLARTQKRKGQSAVAGLLKHLHIMSYWLN